MGITLLRRLSKQFTKNLSIYIQPKCAAPIIFTMPSTKEIGISPTNSWKSDHKLFKWALFGVIVAGTSYWLVKNYR